MTPEEMEDAIDQAAMRLRTRLERILRILDTEDAMESRGIVDQLYDNPERRLRDVKRKWRYRK